MVRSRFAAQMELLNTELIVMGTLCENALEHVTQALQEDNDALNREIVILGKRTEEKEREVENICINLLLKQQPVASDLRQISAALKMITDLSRIGEQAGNVADLFFKQFLKHGAFLDTEVAKMLDGLFYRSENNFPLAFVHFNDFRLDYVRHLQQCLEPVGGECDIQFVGYLFDLAVVTFKSCQIDLRGSILPYIFNVNAEIDLTPFKRLEQLAADLHLLVFVDRRNAG